MNELYSDGRFKGSKNPNFGNDAVKNAWKDGKYNNRKLPKHGIGKGGRHNGIWMRSSYELEFASMLDEKKIEFDYEPKRFYLSDGKNYTPDFYIKKLNLWIEIKGYWFPKAKEKFEKFKQEYPDVDIVCIQGKPLWHPALNG